MNRTKLTIEEINEIDKLTEEILEIYNDTIDLKNLRIADLNSVHIQISNKIRQYILEHY